MTEIIDGLLKVLGVCVVLILLMWLQGIGIDLLEKLLERWEHRKKLFK
jgi:hypothetical protein